MSELTELLGTLATSLGVAVSDIFVVFVKQARTDFIASTIQYIICIFGTIFLIRYIIRTDFEDNPKMGIIVAVCSFVLFTIDIIAFFYLGDYFASIINPEYWAYQNIVSSVSRLKQ